MSDSEKATAVPRSRDWHRDYAEANNYFWLPCPLCGEMFGGHEKGNGHLFYGNGRGSVVCAGCATRAAEMSKELSKAEATADQSK